MPDASNETPKKRGRPRGKGAETRANILTVARTVFSEIGFERTTIRLIGERAGIDPSLVMQYFGSKEKLFLESTDKPELMLSLEYVFTNIPICDWGKHIAEVLSEPGDQRTFVLQTEAIVRAAASRLEAAETLRAMCEKYFLAGFVAGGLRHPELRATLLASFVIGILYTGRIIEMPGFFLAPAELRTPIISDIIQVILTHPIDVSSQPTSL